MEKVAVLDRKICEKCNNGIGYIQPEQNSDLDDLLAKPTPDDGSERIYNGDFFIHERTRKRFVFFSDILGTRIEEYKEP